MVIPKSETIYKGNCGMQHGYTCSSIILNYSCDNGTIPEYTFSVHAIFPCFTTFVIYLSTYFYFLRVEWGMGWGFLLGLPLVCLSMFGNIYVSILFPLSLNSMSVGGDTIV